MTLRLIRAGRRRTLANMLVDLDVWAGDIHAGSLPQICVFSGEPTRGVHTVRYSTFPRWVWALLFAGLVPFIVGVALTRRTVVGTLPMNVRALRRFVVQRVATLVIVAGIPVQRLYAGRVPQWQVGTVPTSFAHVPLPAGYAPPPPPPGWSPAPWNVGGVSSAPPVPPPAR